MLLGRQSSANEESLPTDLQPKILRSLHSLRMTDPSNMSFWGGRHQTMLLGWQSLADEESLIADLQPKILRSLRSLRMTNPTKNLYQPTCNQRFFGRFAPSEW